MTPPERFIDASVFVHAYLKPKRPLKPLEAQIKDAAKKIIIRINNGERVITSVVHFGEISNILEDHLPLTDALSIERALCLRENITVEGVLHEDYISALDEAERHRVGVNDALAYVVMKKHGLSEIYSFDKDFDKFEDAKRLRA